MSDIKRIPTPYSYSSAVVAGDYVFLGLHRGFGDVFSDQLENTFDQLKVTLAELELTFENLVKVQVWLKNIDDLPEMERLFHNHFEKDKFPARMTSTTEFIDADCLVMIEGVAYITDVVANPLVAHDCGLNRQARAHGFSSSQTTSKKLQEASLPPANASKPVNRLNLWNLAVIVPLYFIADCADNLRMQNRSLGKW